MIRRPKIWLAAAVVFTLVNVAGAILAAVMREWMHALTHVALAIGGVAAVQYIRGEREDVAVNPELMAPVELDGRLTHLEMSVEDVAEQVERLGEGQRVINKLFSSEGKASQMGKAPESGGKQ